MGDTEMFPSLNKLLMLMLKS